MTGPAHNITVYRPDYTRIGWIADYQSSAATWQNNGVGTATIVVDEDVEVPEPVLQLSENSTKVVPVLVVDDSGPWTGRVAHTDREGPPGRGTVTSTLVDDWVWLRSMLAWPVPTAPISAQTSVYDTRTGPVETAIKGYLQAAIDRLGVPLAVVPAPAVDTSPSDYPTPNARFTPLDELLLPMLKATGRRLTAVLWLPGTPQPRGLTLTVPTIVLDVVIPPDAGHVLWTDAHIVSRKLSTSSPDAVLAAIGMKGEDLDRLFTQARDDALAATLGAYALPELMVNATDLDTTPEGQVRGLQKLREVAGSAALSIDVGDGVPYTLGDDYHVGSRVRATTSGVPIADVVDRATVTHNRGAGRVVTTQIGPSSSDESTEAIVLDQVAAITAAIVRMNSGR